MAYTLIMKGANFSTNKLATVSFDAVPCTALALDESTLELTGAGSTATLTATPTPGNTTDTITWASSNESVATVSNGIVTSVGVGSATITATCGTQTATCAVTVEEAAPSYVAVAGYAPAKRSSTVPATTTAKATGETSNNFIIAANQASGLYPIESKTNVDTSPYRFVPIIIPTGATKIKITKTSDSFYTRFLWFDSTKQETYTNVGAWCVQGATSGWDQGSRATNTYTIDIPTNVDGLDSFCLALNSSYNTWTTGTDYASDIGVEFLTE